MRIVMKEVVRHLRAADLCMISSLVCVAEGDQLPEELVRRCVSQLERGAGISLDLGGRRCVGKPTVFLIELIEYDPKMSDVAQSFCSDGSLPLFCDK